MEDLYYFIGLIVFWLGGLIATLLIVGFIGKTIINELANIFKNMWLLWEFTYYRNSFKKWVSKKERHPHLKKS